jgi:AcrR family transcriptional regulator
MPRTSQHDWLAAGLRILRAEGAGGLTIERLTNALQLTKGSFYHHFQGWADYKTALLRFFEHQDTLGVITLVEQEPDPAAKLRRLFAIVTSDPLELEAAIRSWALQDAEVHAMQSRIDTQRIAYTQALYTALLDDPARAEVVGVLAYAVLVGSTQIQPPLSLSMLRQMFDEFERLYGISDRREQGTGNREQEIGDGLHLEDNNPKSKI